MSPGPAKTPIEVLRKRGSWRAKARSKKPKAAPVVRKPIRMRPVRKIEALIRTLPNFDPFADPGDCVFDARKAKSAIKFIETQCMHVKGPLAGKPFALEDWQRAYVANIHGWRHPDGRRRFRESLLAIGRKNGKTALCAALLLQELFENPEAGKEIYGCASEFQQASLVFAHAAGMVRQNPALAERVQVYRGQQKAIQMHDDFSTYRVLSASTTSLHGLNTSMYIVDELHCLPDVELLDIMETSTGARPEPLGILISTADYNRTESPYLMKRDYALKVCSGTISDPSFLPAIYEAERDDDWESPATWAKANPNMGVSISEEYLTAQAKKAKDSPRFLNSFLRLHCNIITEQDVRWIEMDKWDACAGEPLRIEDFAGRECWAGLDLASTRDLTALVMCFPGDGVLALLPMFWIPRATALERERRDRVPYLQWIREGWIRPTEGDAVDYACVRRDINEMVEKYQINIRELAIDRLFQGAQLGRELADQDGFEVIAHGQGFLSMAAPTKRFEELIIDGSIRHGGNPVLRWHASNVSVELDAAGNMKPSRKKSTEKIDGIVAAIMAVGRCVSRSCERSVYEDRGILEI